MEDTVADGTKAQSHPARRNHFRFVGSVLRHLFWPRKNGDKLARVLGALSIVALVQQSWNFGLSTTLETILTYYDRLVGLLGSLAEPFIRPALTWIAQRLDLDLTLYAHWKHVFVLMGLYFFREAQITWNAGYRASAVFVFVWGFLVALATSVAVGTLDLTQASTIAQFAVGAVPMVGVFLFDAVDYAVDFAFVRAGRPGKPPRRIYFSAHGGYALLRVAIGIAFVWFGLQLGFIRDLRSPGLALLGASIVLLALFWMWRGASYVATIRQDGEGWWGAYFRTGAAALGAAMLGAFGYALIFTAANAGLQSYGL